MSFETAARAAAGIDGEALCDAVARDVRELLVSAGDGLSEVEERIVRLAAAKTFERIASTMNLALICE